VVGLCSMDSCVGQFSVVRRPASHHRRGGGGCVLWTDVSDRSLKIRISTTSSTSVPYFSSVPLVPFRQLCRTDVVSEDTATRRRCDRATLVFGFRRTKNTGGETAARGTRKLITSFRFKPGRFLALPTYYFPLTTLYSRPAANAVLSDKCE
jgi:hypothetical protein